MEEESRHRWAEAETAGRPAQWGAEAADQS